MGRLPEFAAAEDAAITGGFFFFQGGDLESFKLEIVEPDEDFNVAGRRICCGCW